MNAFRVSTHSTFMRFLSGLRQNQFRSARAQEQLASGRRILRPSDDPTGAAEALSLSRRIAGVERFGKAAVSGQRVVDAAASSLQRASTLLTDARELVVQAMNGTLNEGDRQLLADEIAVLKDQLVDAANATLDGRRLFAGTATDAAPWEEVTLGGRPRVVYRGDGGSTSVRVGDGVEVPIHVPGARIFASSDPSGTRLTGETGLAPGTTAGEGSGYEVLVLRHDATEPGALGSAGIGLVDGGARDTLLGAHELVVDAAAGTVRLGDGPEVLLPPAGDPARSDLVVENGLGGELHLDLSAWTGADFTGDVTGQGSASLDGESFTALDLAATDQAFENPATGARVHVDATGLGRAGEELVTYGGTVNAFDVLQGIVEDLESGAELETGEVVARLETRLDELDRNQDEILRQASVLGARSRRLASSGERAQELGIQMEGLLSRVQDADVTEVALDLARADLGLQLAQGASSRLLQTSLLNFLG